MQKHESNFLSKELWIVRKEVGERNGGIFVCEFVAYLFVFTK